jgi:hypothetical protein
MKRIILKISENKNMFKLHQNLSKKTITAFLKVTVATLCIVLIALFMTASCEKPKPNNDVPQGTITTTNFAGTSWKLVGFVNNQNNAIIVEVEPKCDGCYTLVFDTDSTASGYSIGNWIGLSLRPTVQMWIRPMLDDSMSSTVGMFYEAMKSVESYSVENDTLKIFYNNNENYLLYKP